MTSDDDDYYYDIRPDRRYDQRKTNRPRRRNSASSRRHLSRHTHLPFHKTRRPKSWYNFNAARLMAASIFISLLGYEVFILKTPLTTDVYSANTPRIAVKSNTAANPAATKDSTSYSSSKTQPPSLQAPSRSTAPPAAVPPQPAVPPAPNAASQASTNSESKSSSLADSIAASVPKPPSLSKDSTSSRPISDVPADADAEPPKSGMQSSSSYQPLRRRTHPPSSPSSPTQKIPASALRLGVSEKPSEKGSASSTSDNLESSGRDSEKPASASSFTTVSDSGSSSSSSLSDSKALQVGPTSKDASNSTGGANPGAGENFWQWFQETKGKEKGGVSKTVNCPDDTKRLCTMFYKYVRKYKIRSIFDISCVKNLEWMPEILKKAGGELWGFKYYCSAPEEEGMEKAKTKLSSFKFVEFVADQWWRKGFSQKPELLFAWDTLPHIAYGRVWHFFVKAKSQNIKYILVDNYPGILNDPSPKRMYINLRKHPFRFPAAKEVVQNVTEPGETEKRQLLFYESTMLPENLQ